MRYFTVLGLLGVGLSSLGVAGQSLAPRPSVSVPAGAVEGDFDGDGAPEYAWLVPAPRTPDSMACAGPCTSYLRFSSPHLQPLAVEKCIGGTLANLGDLNGDGADELGLLPDWCTSCWRSYIVYAYEHGRWGYAVPPFAVHCNQWEAGVKPIEKDPATPGHVIVRYSEFTGSDIAVKAKSEPVK